MKKILLLILICTSFVTFAQDVDSTEKTTTFYLISNGEKKEPSEKYPDPYLSDAGVSRAENWVKVLANVAFDGVYAQNLISVKQTAQIVGTSKELGVFELDTNTLYDAAFKYTTNGKSNLIVADNATLVKFANSVVGEEKFKVSEDVNYSILYIISVTKNGKETILLDIN